jgi:hypothetical protein
MRDQYLRFAVLPFSEVSTISIHLERPTDTARREANVELQELFEAARRSAMGVEKALDEILNLLGANEGKR